MKERGMDSATVPVRLWWWALGLVLVTLALQVYALSAYRYPPLVDLPNHMARHSLETVCLSGAELPPFYAINYRVLPNLGADLVVPPLMLVLSPLTACKVFLILSAFLYWLGPALFIVQYRGLTTGAVLAALLWLPLGFSSQFFWGFLNYYSGFGLAFLALAHYLWLGRHERVRLPHLVLQALLGALLFLWHLAPWGLYVVILSCHLVATTLTRYRQERRLTPCLRSVLYSLGPLLPGGLLCLYYLAANAGAEGARAFLWGGWSRKLLMVVGLFRGYDTRADLVMILFWLAAVAAAFGPSLFRCLRLGWILLPLVALSILYMVLPLQLGATSDVDSRLLPALLVCLLAWLSAYPVRGFRLAVVLLAVCLLVRYGSVVQAWGGLADRLDSHAQAFALLPPQSRVLPVVTSELSKTNPEEHFLCWAVMDRNIFVPTLFHLKDQHTLTLRAPGWLCRRAPDGSFDLDKAAVRREYDYVWVYNPEAKDVRVPERFEKVFSERGLTVWRVR